MTKFAFRAQEMLRKKFTLLKVNKNNLESN